jgi:hypothetical protein
MKLTRLRGNTTMKPICGAAAAIFALALLSAGGGAALAQGAAPPAGAAAAGGPPQAAGEPSSEATPPAGEPARQAPVLLITSVEVMRSTHPPELDVLRVHGLTATTGWSNPVLKPLTEGVEPDGILDLVLVADAPPSGSQPLGFSPIAQVLPIATGHPYKGFRIHGGMNGLTILTLPGYVDVSPTVEDCEKCIGKIFVPTGGTVPAGKTAADVVKQESLPPLLRIVRPTDGIMLAYPNPNRLTLVLNAAGMIVDAGWD